jgi:hypothetical protein
MSRTWDELPPELAASIRYGRLPSPLPYLLQDGYGRSRTPYPQPRCCTATPRSSRPISRCATCGSPAAWKWNLCSTGHSTLTCAPMHAAAVEGPDGSLVLRLWE